MRHRGHGTRKSQPSTEEAINELARRLAKKLKVDVGQLFYNDAEGRWYVTRDGVTEEVAWNEYMFL